MRNVGSLAVGLVLLGGAALIGWKLVLPSLGRSRATVPTAPDATIKNLPADFVARFKAADDDDAADMLRLARDRYTLPSQKQQLATLREERGSGARKRFEDALDGLIAGSQYVEARMALARFTGNWKAFANGLEASLDETQATDLQRRLDDADQLLEDGRYDAARESLDIPAGRFERDEHERIQKHRTTIERRIRVRQYESNRHVPIIDNQPTPEAKAGHPSAPPSLPGHPHPDVKRLAEANALLAKAAKLFRAGKYGPLAKAAEELVGYYGDLKMVKRRTVTLTYTFASDDEYFDWEAIKLFPHADGGQFETARLGVRGTGVAGYVNRAFFAADDVEMSCEAHIQNPRSHGIGFIEAGNETRQVLLLCTNHWFTEGENYVKKRPGHSILLIGKGVNNDVPVDSPEIGFVFKGPSYTKPAPGPGAKIRESIAMLGANVRAEVRGRGGDSTLQVSARGDDGRGFKRHRPTLYVVQAGVIFRNIRIRGRIDPAFAHERESELLDEVESALADAP